MPSSPNEASVIAADRAADLTAETAPRAAPLDAATDALVVRQRSWIKRMLPQTMFGRSLLLIVMPLVLVQIIAIWVFYARHWETVSRRLASDVAGDIGLLIEAMRFTDNELELARLLENAFTLTGIAFSTAPGARRSRIRSSRLRRWPSWSWPMTSRWVV